MGRLRIVAIVGAVLAIACTAPAGAQESAPSGVWRGVGVQSTATGDAETWTVRVTFAERAVRVEYPTLGCSGAWVREGAHYRERIATGDCIDRGRVSVHMQDGKLFMNWTVEGESPDIAASAVLFASAPVA